MCELNVGQCRWMVYFEWMNESYPWKKEWISEWKIPSRWWRYRCERLRWSYNRIIQWDKENGWYNQCKWVQNTLCQSKYWLDWRLSLLVFSEVYLLWYNTLSPITTNYHFPFFPDASWYLSSAKMIVSIDICVTSQSIIIREYHIQHLYCINWSLSFTAGFFSLRILCNCLLHTGLFTEYIVRQSSVITVCDSYITVWNKIVIWLVVSSCYRVHRLL